MTIKTKKKTLNRKTQKLLQRYLHGHKKNDKICKNNIQSYNYS